MIQSTAASRGEFEKCLKGNQRERWRKRRRQRNEKKQMRGKQVLRIWRLTGLLRRGISSVARISLSNQHTVLRLPAFILLTGRCSARRFLAQARNDGTLQKTPAGQNRWEMGLACVGKAFEGVQSAGDHRERQSLMIATTMANACRSSTLENADSHRK